VLGAFEWLVARRYLQRDRKRSLRLHWVTAVVWLIAAVAIGIALFVDHSRSGLATELRLGFGGSIRLVRLGAIVIAVLVTVFNLIVRRLTLFSTISTYGLWLGTGALVIVLSVMSGFENDLRRKILGAHADIVVTQKEGAFVDYGKVLEQIDKVHGIVGASPFLSSEVILSSQSNLSGVVLKGIDPRTVGSVTDLRKNIEHGSLDDLSTPEKIKPPDPPLVLDGAGEEIPPPQLKEPPLPRRIPPGVVVGRELAKNMHLYTGDDVDLVSPFGGVGPTGPIPKSKPFRLAGIFFSGMFEYDSKYIYLELGAAQRFLGMEGEVTGIELKVEDPDRSEGWVAALQAQLGPAYEVQDWKELNRSLFSALKLEKLLMFIILGFIILVAAFSIIANGIMLVMEKGKEIAILKSMGASDQSVLGVFLLVGLVTGAIGASGGVAAGLIACVLLDKLGLSLDSDVYYITKLPVTIHPWEIATVFVSALIIVLLATLYPAYLAARLRPVEGLRL
jgi:lipoprotein-releasing system permease protein